MAELARNRLRTKGAERVENPNHSDPFGLCADRRSLRDHDLTFIVLR